ncbi:hypothetical protein [Promicromonospora iranensis]|uniref:Uncharacterized protein n=1 Tax=Promicromonospora iranensis TaxID=1105144 RepID=A0ABU2CN06_9MICO|nr:hypothetical protein [Promicromonospora iranensis]MDR7382651.1 hypothetical protein [Promicromonospora iranensis]
MSDAQYQKLDGNADLVLSKGRSYQAIAESIENALTALDAIVDDNGTTAQSMAKTRELAGDVRDDIKKATGRYRVTGDALDKYAPTLASSIETSETAATRIAEIQSDLYDARLAKFNAENGVDDLRDDATPADKSEANSAATAASSKVETLESDLIYWQGRWQDAKDAKDTAARTARNAIDEQFERDEKNDLHDSGWDKVVDFVSGVYKVFKIICDIAGILAIFLSWVPILGQVLLVLAAIGAILTILESVVKFAKGEIGWGGLLLGVGLGLVGLFGGKLATSLGKVAKARAVTNAVATTNSTSRLAARLGTGANQAEKIADGMKLIDEAGETMANADNLLSFKSVLKSPFTRSDSAADLFELRKAGNLGFMEGVGKAAKEAFVFPLKNPFGGSAAILRDPALFHNAGGLVGATASMELANLASSGVKSAIGIDAAFGGNDGWAQANSVIGTTGPVVEGVYSNIAQLPGKAVSWGKTIDGIF